ncbi:ABC transporter permease [Mucilaginibacter gynuensis]|uniref:ABC transporter permease n=1 Tax=Mucilaginibacter gynuensis TaxID=1302236 RepID=A0ABP8FUE2_9SPHI
MFKTYFKIALRKLSKNKLYSIVNIVGLTVGITSCLLIGLYIINETGYDKFQKNADRIVRVTMEYGEPGNMNKAVTTGTKAGPQLQRTFPQIETYVRVINYSSVVKYEDKVFTEPRFLFADAGFFNVFSFPLLEGDAKSALDGPRKVVISASTAHKYFGNADPVGKVLNVNSDREYQVTGVVADAPENSQIKYDFIASFSTLSASKTEEWWTANYITYLMLDKKESIAPLQTQINAYMTNVSANELKMGKAQLVYNAQPMKEVHLHSDLGGLEANGSIKTIYVISIIALLILVIACINYTNLATVQSSGRSAEIGIRKVLGAQKGQLFGQFIGESFLITLLSLTLAIVLTAALMPYFNDLTGKVLAIASLFKPLPVAALVLLCVLVGFASGSYPALVLANAKLISTLKSGLRLSSSGSYFRKTLIVFQFAVSICLIVSTFVILQQLNFMRNKDLGYDREHVIVLPVDEQMQNSYEAIKAAISVNPNVISVSGANASPTSVGWGDGIDVDNGQKNVSLQITALPSDLGFIKTMNMKIIAGMDYTEADYAQMDTSNHGKNFKYAFILNETAVKALGLTPEQAIGRRAEKGGTPGVIKAVIKDFNFASLHENVGPLMLFLDKQFTNDIFIKTNGKNIPATLSFLKAMWKERVPHRPFEYSFLDENYNKLYVTEQKTAQIFSTFSTLAILLACLGLFALAAFATMQRTKEIGIRKVLGASVSGIVGLISKEFLVLTLIAIVIASPAAWYFMNKWLQDFAYRINIQWWVFVVAGGLTLVIAFITVSLQSIKAAIANPVKSLRSE